MAFSNDVPSLMPSTVPLVFDLEADGTADFHFIQGTVELPPMPGYEDFFGPPPLYSFYDHDLLAVLERRGLRENLIPARASPEEILRHNFTDEYIKGHESVVSATARLQRLLEEQGPFDGIIGFSEGALVAATLLVDCLHSSQGSNSVSTFKCAVFLCGSPPISVDGKRFLLSDEVGHLLPLHTCHVIGSSDPLLPTSMALYNVCDPATAVIFDHGKGHHLTWDPKTMKDLAKVVRALIKRASD